MKGIFDASSLLNLAHGEVLTTILKIPNFEASVGPQVRHECGSIGRRIDILIETGKLSLLDDEALPAANFLVLLDRYGLGVGETECLAFAKLGTEIVCCDDRKARVMIEEEIGPKRVIGSLGLLVQAAHFELLSVDAAFAAYEQMRLCGGFLPEISIEDLANALATLRK